MQSLVPLPTTDKGEEEFGWMMSRVMATSLVSRIVPITCGEVTTVGIMRMLVLNAVSSVLVYPFVCLFIDIYLFIYYCLFIIMYTRDQMDRLYVCISVCKSKDVRRWRYTVKRSIYNVVTIAVINGFAEKILV